MEISEQPSVLSLHPDARTLRNLADARRLSFRLAAGLAISVGLWLLLRFAGFWWPTLAPGQPLAFLIFLVIFFFVSTCGTLLVIFLIDSYTCPANTCTLDKRAGRITISPRGIWDWLPVRKLAFPLQQVSAVLLWKVRHGPVWLGLQVAGKRVKLEATTSRDVMFAEPGQELDAFLVADGVAGRPLPVIAEQISRFLGVPLLNNLGLKDGE